MNDLYREEREARWRDGLRLYGSNLEVMGEALRRLADNPDSAAAKAESDKIAHLIRATADVIERFSVDNPPKRSQE